METKTIYLAGGLFNAAERLHNLYLEKYLRLLEYEVILPQREALKHLKKNGGFNIDVIKEECKQFASNPNNICVVSADGPDADSGGSVTYRTDFRTSMEEELGINCMLILKETKFIYEPCYFTELSEVELFYAKLAWKINLAIKELA